MPDFRLEQELYGRGFRIIAGADEAGRGPLAGPIVVGAAVLPPYLDGPPEWLETVRDSKKLTPRRRERALAELHRHAIAIATGEATAREIDGLGLTRATHLALLRAVTGLRVQPDYLLLDFMRSLPREWPCRAVVDGDDLCYSIAAASIAAKVTRDRWMEAADRCYPGYGFARHKGYPTSAHMEALRQLGPCPIHRTSFAPVRRSLARRSSL